MERTFEIKENDRDNYFSRLPYELLVHVLSYLDFRTLQRCSRVNRTWYVVTKDPHIFRILNFQHLPRVSQELVHNLLRFKKIINGLDISWAYKLHKNDKIFTIFLKACRPNLTYLSCELCNFTNTYTMRQIGNLKQLKTLRMRNCELMSRNYYPLKHLTQLTTLSIHKTNISTDQLVLVLKHNPLLKHLYISLCRRVKLDEIAKCAGEHNKALVTWSSNEMRSISDVGLAALGECLNLEDLDLSWCQWGYCNFTPLFEIIAYNCPKLQRLILGGWRGVTDIMLMPFIKYCTHLKYLDFDHMLDINGPICVNALNSLSEIKYLFINGCSCIDESEVEKWKRQFPHVNIKWDLNSFEELELLE